MLSFFSSLLLTIVIIYIGNTFFHFSLDIYKSTLWFCIGLILLAINLRTLKETLEIWDFSNQILTKQTPINSTFNLDKIEYIVFGIPQPKWVSYLQKLLFISNKNIIYTSSLTIKFTDETYLILNMSQIDNGMELINKILQNNQAKIIENYIFTEYEREILKLNQANKLLK